MSHQPPESHKLRRRLILASVLTGGTFFVAHSINSVVASSIAYSAPAGLSRTIVVKFFPP